MEISSGKSIWKNANQEILSITASEQYWNALLPAITLVNSGMSVHYSIPLHPLSITTREPYWKALLPTTTVLKEEISVHYFIRKRTPQNQRWSNETAISHMNWRQKRENYSTRTAMLWYFQIPHLNTRGNRFRAQLSNPFLASLVNHSHHNHSLLNTA